MRPSNRETNQPRIVKITRQYTQHAEGSVLIEFGGTRVLCNASVLENVPRFLKGKNQGWITAEYGMLPRATHDRSDREASKGKQNGRTLEIQRLIGRSLRMCVDLKTIGERTITLDCDVIQADGGSDAGFNNEPAIQADGGTRTAAITGACIALHDALSKLVSNNQLKKMPEFQFIAAISVGIYRGNPVLDLDYSEDVLAETDMNIIMNEAGQFIEVQGTAEAKSFSRDELNALLDLAETGIHTLIAHQKEALKLT